jgi:predicted Rossmann-fold nucleotide-binding protein
MRSLQTQIFNPDATQFPAVTIGSGPYITVGSEALSLRDIKLRLNAFHGVVGSAVERSTINNKTQDTDLVELQLLRDFNKSIQRSQSVIERHYNGQLPKEGSALEILHQNIQDVTDALYKLRLHHTYYHRRSGERPLVTAVQSSRRTAPEFFEKIAEIDADYMTGGSRNSDGHFQVIRVGQDREPWSLLSKNALPAFDNLFAGARAIFFDEDPGLGTWLKFTYVLQLVQVGHLPKVPIYLVGGERDWGVMSSLAQAYLRDDIYGVPFISTVNPEAQNASDATLFTIVDSTADAIEHFKNHREDQEQQMQTVGKSVLYDHEFSQLEELVLSPLMHIEAALESVVYKQEGHTGISIFGTARSSRRMHKIQNSDLNCYELTYDMAYRLAQEGVTIINGGGPGAMEAATYGGKDAGIKRPLRLTVDLPFEPQQNDPETVQHHHARFSSRLNEFFKASDAFVITPGGYGTLLEAIFVARCNQIRIKLGKRVKPLIIARFAEQDLIADRIYEMMRRLHEQKHFGEMKWINDGIPFIEVVDMRNGAAELINKLNSYGIIK